MSRRPSPLPEGLGSPVSVRTARDLRVSDRRLRAADLASPQHGVRASGEPSTVLERSAALAAAVGAEAVFSHRTAAELLGRPLVHPDDGALHVTNRPGGTRISRPGVVCHRRQPSGLLRVRGLCVTDPVVTWADLAPLRGGESVMETRARLLMLDAGLPEPELNRDVLFEHAGWLACPDFSWPGLNVAVEYDGDHHRTDRRQWQRDIARRRLLQEEGWTVIVITADDVLRTPAHMVAMIRDALAAATTRRSARA